MFPAFWTSHASKSIFTSTCRPTLAGQRKNIAMSMCSHIHASLPKAISQREKFTICVLHKYQLWTFDAECRNRRLQTSNFRCPSCYATSFRFYKTISLGGYILTLWQFLNGTVSEMQTVGRQLPRHRNGITSVANVRVVCHGDHDIRIIWEQCETHHDISWSEF